MTRKWLSSAPVALAVLLAFVLAGVDARLHPSVTAFSDDSLKQLSVLNHRFGMSVQDLSETKNSPLVAQLYAANALLPMEAADKNALGLLATLEGTNTVLLLQPTTPLSPEALSSAVETYTSSIPEFSHVEMDQSLELESLFWNWNLDKSSPVLTPVELSSDEAQATEAVPVATPIKVAVIDSGVDETHEVFGATTMNTGWNTLSEDDTMYDDVGHGTHIAGIIAVNAPGVEIIPYKIVGASGGKLSNVLEAFSRAIEDEVDVINTSFGVPSASYALQNEVTQAYEAGIVVVSAAGNSGANTGFYPAHYAQTIAVGSVDLGGHQLPSSNYGSWVDVAANGYHVRSSLPNNAYGYKSGTSQATAFVSAAVARLLQANADLSFEEIMTALNQSTQRVSEGTLAGTAIVE